MLLPSEVEVPGTSVFVRENVCVCVRAWEYGKERRKHVAHSHSFHPSHVHRVSLNHRNTESYESNQRVSECVCGSESERECMSFNAISRHL